MKATAYINNPPDSSLIKGYYSLPNRYNSSGEKARFLFSLGFYDELSPKWCIGAHLSFSRLNWTDHIMEYKNGRAAVTDTNLVVLANPLMLGHVSISRKFYIFPGYAYAGVKLGFAYAGSGDRSHIKVGSSAGMAAGYCYPLGDKVTMFLDNTFTTLTITYNEVFNATNFVYQGSLGIRLEL